MDVKTFLEKYPDSNMYVQDYGIDPSQLIVKVKEHYIKIKGKRLSLVSEGHGSIYNKDILPKNEPKALLAITDLVNNIKFKRIDAVEFNYLGKAKTIEDLNLDLEEARLLLLSYESFITQIKNNIDGTLEETPDKSEDSIQQIASPTFGSKGYKTTISTERKSRTVSKKHLYDSNRFS